MFLEHKYADIFRSALKMYDRPLEIATDKVQAEKMTEREWLNDTAVLQAAREKVKNQWVRLTHQAWNSVVGA